LAPLSVIWDQIPESWAQKGQRYKNLKFACGMHAANIRRQYFATPSRAKPRGDPRAAAEVSTLSYIRSSPASKPQSMYKNSPTKI